MESVHGAKAELHAQVARACGEALARFRPEVGHGLGPGLEAALQLLYVAPCSATASQPGGLGEAGALGRTVFVEHLAGPLLARVVQLREQLAVSLSPAADSISMLAGHEGSEPEDRNTDAGAAQPLACVPVREVCTLLQLAAFLFGASTPTAAAAGAQATDAGAQGAQGAHNLPAATQPQHPDTCVAVDPARSCSPVMAALAVETHVLADQLLACLVLVHERAEAQSLFRAAGSRLGAAGSAAGVDNGGVESGSMHVGFQVLLSPQDVLSPVLYPDLPGMGSGHQQATQPAVSLCKAALRCAAKLRHLRHHPTPDVAEPEAGSAGAGAGTSRQGSAATGLAVQQPHAVGGAGQPRLQLETSLSLSLAHSLHLPSGEPSPAMAGNSPGEILHDRVLSAQLLSAALSLPELRSVRREVRALLGLVAQGGHTWQQEAAVQAVARAAWRLGAVSQALQARPDDWPLLCCLSAVLCDLEPAVVAAPTAWVMHCAANPTLLPQLVQHAAVALAVHPPAARTALQLVCQALNGAPAAAASAGTQPSGGGGAATAWLGLPLPAQPLSQLLLALRQTQTYALASTFLLCGWDEQVRTTTASLLRTLWRRLQLQEQRQLLLVLLDLLPAVPRLGDAGKQLVDLICQLLASAAAAEQQPAHVIPSGSSQMQPAATGQQGAGRPSSTPATMAPKPGGNAAAVQAGRLGPKQQAVQPAAGRAGSGQSSVSSHQEGVAKSIRTMGTPGSSGPSLLSHDDLAFAAAVMVGVLRQAHGVVAAHPLAEIYTRLVQVGLDTGAAGLVPLEVVPCAIGAPMDAAAFTTTKLENLRAEARYAAAWFDMVLLGSWGTAVV